MPLTQLTYISRSLIKYELPAQLQLLHAGARKANYELGVTGILLYKSGCFLQLLEGRSQVVARLLDKIAADPRHVDVQLLYSKPIGQRDFSGWDMGLLNLDEGTEFEKQRFDDLLRACRDVSRDVSHQGMVRRLYSEFRDQLEHTAEVGK